MVAVRNQPGPDHVGITSSPVLFCLCAALWSLFDSLVHRRKQSLIRWTLTDWVYWSRGSISIWKHVRSQSCSYISKVQTDGSSVPRGRTASWLSYLCRLTFIYIYIYILLPSYYPSFSLQPCQMWHQWRLSVHISSHHTALWLLPPAFSQSFPNPFVLYHSFTLNLSGFNLRHFSTSSLPNVHLCSSYLLSLLTASLIHSELSPPPLLRSIFIFLFFFFHTIMRNWLLISLYLFRWAVSKRPQSLLLSSDWLKYETVIKPDTSVAAVENTPVLLC